MKSKEAREQDIKDYDKLRYEAKHIKKKDNLKKAGVKYEK